MKNEAAFIRLPGFSPIELPPNLDPKVKSAVESVAYSGRLEYFLREQGAPESLIDRYRESVAKLERG